MLSPMIPRLAALVAIVACLAGCGTVPTEPVQVEPKSFTAQQVVPSEMLNHDVRQETIDLTICTPGYTASVRPSTSFTNGIKAKLLREAGLAAEDARDYELDHHVALALGGHPRNLRNLALQRWEGEDGAKRKDVLEKRLQRLVCSRSLPLAAAQWAIYSDWRAAYRRYVVENQGQANQTRAYDPLKVALRMPHPRAVSMARSMPRATPPGT